MGRVGRSIPARIEPRYTNGESGLVQIVKIIQRPTLAVTVVVGRDVEAGVGDDYVIQGWIIIFTTMTVNCRWSIKQVNVNLKTVDTREYTCTNVLLKSEEIVYLKKYI